MIPTHTITCPQGISSDASMFLLRWTVYFGPGRRVNSWLWTLMFKKMRGLGNLSLACVGSIHLGEGVLERHMEPCAVGPWSITSTPPPSSGGEQMAFQQESLPASLSSLIPRPWGGIGIHPERLAQMSLSWLFQSFAFSVCKIPWVW